MLAIKMPFTKLFLELQNTMMISSAISNPSQRLRRSYAIIRMINNDQPSILVQRFSFIDKMKALLHTTISIDNFSVILISLQWRSTHLSISGYTI
jgi:hypothetical protein